VAAAESIAAAMLGSITAADVYPVSRPTIDTLPAVVWSVISIVPEGRLSQSTGTNLYTARIQADCLATSYSGLKTVADAVRAAVHLKSGTYASKTVMQSVIDTIRSDDIDLETGIYSQSVDFMITFYD
jgi:hypothetical protein